MKKIRLGVKSHMGHTLIDDEDFPIISKYKWFAFHSGKRLKYALSTSRSFSGEKIFMHRLILGFPEKQIDHINCDGLDNRKSNLRLCTSQQNKWNQRKREIGSSRFRGVRKSSKSNSWQAGITVSYKRMHLGSYKSEEDAARVYDRAANKYYGEFAYLNFPLEKA